MNIVNYVQKFHRHPVTGQPLALKDIVTLTFHKNADGEYHCPVLHKVFTESTHIVAIRNTGHVYCYEVRPADRHVWFCASYPPPLPCASKRSNALSPHCSIDLLILRLRSSVNSLTII